MDKTLIFCTENRCPEPLFSSVISNLKSKVNRQPVISVSFTPIDLGTNISIGGYKRSWRRLYEQLLLGCKLAETKYVGIIEHDCFYTEEHLEYIPPSDDKFYYNENVILVNWDEKKHPDKMGMYSRFPHQRLALSQMVCNRELYIKALEGRLALIRRNKEATKQIDHINEPGQSKIAQKLINRANSGSAAYLKKLLPDFIELEQYEVFHNKIPNLDVRHGGNFTGPRRGRKRRYKIKYWGKFKELINENST